MNSEQFFRTFNAEELFSKLPEVSPSVTFFNLICKNSKSPLHQSAPFAICPNNQRRLISIR